MKIIYEGLELMKGIDLFLEPTELSKLSKNESLEVYVADGNLIIEERKKA